MVADSQILLCMQELTDSSFSLYSCFKNPNPLREMEASRKTGVEEGRVTLKLR